MGHNYKYTKDKERILFTENGSKYADDFINLLREIDWNWTFEGESKFLMNDEDSDSTTKFIKIPCKATLPKTPYFVFGGYVYELFNKEYGHLERFLDPTGDVDVRVNLPSIETFPKQGLMDFWYEEIECTRLNEVMDNYVNYLFQSLLKKVEQIQILNTVDFDLKEDDEGNIVQHEKIGHVYVAKVYHPLSVKIQVVCKFKNMDKPDHLFELVWLIKKSVGGVLRTNLVVNPLMNGIFVQSLPSLIVDNIGSADDRIYLYGKPNQHKWFNHIQRLKYTNYIFERIIGSYDKHDKALIASLLCYLFLFLLKTEGAHVFSLGDRVAKTSVIFGQLTSNFLNYVKEYKSKIDMQTRLIFRGQRVTFPIELLNKYLKNGVKDDIQELITEIEKKNKERTVPGSLKPRIVPTKYKSAYSLRRASFKTQDNSKLGLRSRNRKSLRRVKSA